MEEEGSEGGEKEGGKKWGWKYSTTSSLTLIIYNTSERLTNLWDFSIPMYKTMSLYWKVSHL